MGYYKEGRVAVMRGLVDCGLSTDQLSVLAGKTDVRVRVRRFLALEADGVGA